MYWDNGSLRPRWRYMPGLAKLLKIDLTEVVRKFWSEAVGDPCPCDCGGVKVFPNRDGAKHLYIDLPCGQCETPRPPYRTMQGHDELCRACAYKARKQERITCICQGYHSFPYLKIPDHAKRCPLTKDWLPSQAARVKHKKDPGEGYPFVDLERREYRSEYCAGAFRLLRESEENLKRQWKEAHPNESFPRRIQSLNDLRDIQRQLWTTSPLGRNRAHRIVVTNPATFDSEKPKRVRGKAPPHPIHPAVPERKRNWRREKSPRGPAPIRGLCEICDTLLFSYKKSRPMRFHQKCLWKYQKEHGADAGPRNIDGTFTDLSSKPIEVHPRRGQPVTVESLQKHFTWTIRHKLQEDALGQIAKANGITKQSVAEGIDFIMHHLPDPEWVPVAIRQRILALRSFAD